MPTQVYSVGIAQNKKKADREEKTEDRNQKALTGQDCMTLCR